MRKSTRTLPIISCNMIVQCHPLYCAGQPYRTVNNRGRAGTSLSTQDPTFSNTDDKSPHVVRRLDFRPVHGRFLVSWVSLLKVQRRQYKKGSILALVAEPRILHARSSMRSQSGQFNGQRYKAMLEQQLLILFSRAPLSDHSN